MVDGAVFQFLFFPSVKPEDRGFYYCVAENSEGMAVSDPALLSLDGMKLMLYLMLEFNIQLKCTVPM